MRQLCWLSVIILLVEGVCQAQSFHSFDENRLSFWSPELQGLAHRDNGGAFLSLYGNGKLLSSNFPGEGNQSVCETRNGNDATLAGGDGVSAYPISVQGYPSTQGYGYWARESFLSDWEYEVTSFAPHFWSHLLVSSDNLKVAGNWDGRTTPGIPLVFLGGTPSWGAIAMGNHGRFWQYSREDVVARIPKGRVACRMTIELKDGSPDAYASIHFKKTLPDAKRIPTADELWNAPGYTLSVNRLGHLELWASDSAVPVYTTRDIQWIRDWLAAQMALEGVKVEIRTHTWSNDIIEIWVTDTHVAGSIPMMIASVERASPINVGEHFAISAYSTSGEVRFNERVVVDLNLTTRVNYYGGLDGGLVTDTEWFSTTGEPIQLVSATHQLFANLNWANSIWSAERQNQSGSILVNYSPEQRFCVGNGESHEYIEVRVLNAIIDGVKSPGAYVSIQNNPVGNAEILPNAIIHANALPESVWLGIQEAVPTRSVRLVTQQRFIREKLPYQGKRRRM